MFIGHPVRQIAFFVPDVREAATRHAKLYGSGPFFVLDEVKFDSVMYRGEEATLLHTAAFGQWGNLNLEFCQQDGPGPSIFHDLYPEGSGKYGFHHVGLLVDDLRESVKFASEFKFPEIFRGTISAKGLEAVMIDTTSTFGYLTELLQATPAITGFHEEIRRASINYDGKDPIRTAPFLD